MRTILQISICLFLLLTLNINAKDLLLGAKKSSSNISFGKLKKPDLTFKDFYKDFGIQRKSNDTSIEYFIQKAPTKGNMVYNMPKYKPKKNFDYKIQYHIPKGVNKIPKSK